MLINPYVFGGLWTPYQITTALWLDAADASTISTSGSEVTQINDKSGNARNFTGSSGSRPSTGLSMLNGLNILDFDADYLTSASAASTWTFMHNTTGSSVFSVIKAGNTSDPNAIFVIYGTNGATSARVGTSLFFDDRVSTSRNNTIFHSVSAGSQPDNFQVVVQNVTANNSFLPNTFNMVTVLADPGNTTAANRSILKINAGSDIKNNVDTATVGTSNPAFTLQMGANGNNTSSFTGAFAEFIVISGVMSAANRERIEGYLAHKWGLTANLPSDHPYKSAAPLV